MANNLKYTKLQAGSGTFQDMIKSFGVVTVMNVDVYEGPAEANLTLWETLKADAIYENITIGTYVAKAGGPYIWDADQEAYVLAGEGVTGTHDFVPALEKICSLDTLKVASVSQEGPTKTITGGQYANPLVKFGKTSRLEIQDALGNAEALEALAGLLNEWNYSPTATIPPTETRGIYGVHSGTRFEGPKTLIGDTFFVDRAGNQVETKIIFYQFLPDSLFNLAQDSEGDAAVFDLNGDLLVTTISVSDDSNDTVPYGVFYSILDPALL